MKMLKTKNVDDFDSYQYLRTAHMFAIFFGFPHTRRKIKEDTKYEDNIAGNESLNNFTFTLVFNIFLLLLKTENRYVNT